MRFLLTLLLINIALLAHSQKVKVDDGLVTMDGQAYCKMEKTNCKLGYCDFRVTTLDGKEIIFIKIRSYVDHERAGAYSTTGNVVYFDWTFLGSGNKAETDQSSEKNLAKAMVDARLLKDGALVAEGERNFILINGMRHTERQKQLGLPVIIIQR